MNLPNLLHSCLFAMLLAAAAPAAAAAPSGSARAPAGSAVDTEAELPIPDLGADPTKKKRAQKPPPRKPRPT